MSRARPKTVASEPACRALVVASAVTAAACAAAAGAPGAPPPVAAPSPSAVSPAALPSAAPSASRIDAPAPPPPVARREPKTFQLHGHTFVDDYAWLRKKGTPEVVDYLRAENAYAEQVLAPVRPLADALYAELVARVPDDDLSAPVREGGAFYYDRLAAGKEHPIVCRRFGHLDAAEEVLVDLNAIAAKAKFAELGDRAVSPTGRFFAYTVDTNGFRQFALRIVDTDAKRELADSAERVTSLAFVDDRTLFYTVEDAVAKRSHRLYRHVVGGSGADALVYEERDERFELEVERLKSGAFVALHIGSHTTSEVRLVDAKRPLEAPRVVFPRRTDIEYDLDHQGDRFLVRINDRGRNFRVVTLPTKDLTAPPRELWPHSPEVMIEDLEAFADHVVLKERAAGLPRLRVLGARAEAHVVSMPEAAYEVRLDANREFKTSQLRFVYQSPTTPAETIDYDVITRERRVVKRATVRGGFDRDRYQVTRLALRARDGTPIPTTVIHLRGHKPDGTHPLLQWGYGAYGAPLGVKFSSSRLSLLDRGVVVALAHVRGGGELGKPWHDAGRMEHKHRTFEDFVDVTEGLVQAGWAKPGVIAAEGASAGGLLMGAVTNMRPDLYRVVVADVPFVDVVNTMLDESLPLTVGEFEEWGNPKVARELGWMVAYSPYDNLTKRAYPSMLVRSAYNDSQVMYWEPAKYVARLRTVHTGQSPILLRTELEPAGHGGRSGRYEALRDTAADYAFLLWQLGLFPG